LTGVVSVVASSLAILALLAGLVAVDEENYDAECLPPNASPAAK
jgi:hypothetical protein